MFVFADADILVLLERVPISVKINKFDCTGHEARLFDCPFQLECPEIGSGTNCTRFARCSRLQSDTGVTCPSGELDYDEN